MDLVYVADRIAINLSSFQTYENAASTTFASMDKHTEHLVTMDSYSTLIAQCAQPLDVVCSTIYQFVVKVVLYCPMCTIAVITFSVNQIKWTQS